MTRNHRLPLILAMTVVLVLASVPLANARPLVFSQAIEERTVDGWFGAALRWLEGLVGRQGSTSKRASHPAESGQMEDDSVSGGSCIDPAGRPWCTM
jgi:hypothetical protein